MEEEFRELADRRTNTLTSPRPKHGTPMILHRIFGLIATAALALGIVVQVYLLIRKPIKEFS